MIDENNYIVPINLKKNKEDEEMKNNQFEITTLETEIKDKDENYYSYIDMLDYEIK